MPTKSQQRNTFPVSDKVFKAVYDSPQSLPGKHKWLTAEADVRKIVDRKRGQATLIEQEEKGVSNHYLN